MMVWLALATAMAQDTPDVAPPQLNAQIYRPSIDSERSLFADDAGLAPHGTVHVRAGLNYSNGLMGAVRLKEGEDELFRVVTHAIAGDVTAGFTAKALRVGVHVPVWLTIGSDLPSVGGSGIGDLGLDMKVTALDPREANIGLAFAGRVTAPTANILAPIADDGVSWEAQVIVDKRWDELALVANLGTRGAPVVESLNVTLGSAAFYRVALSYAASDDLGASLDLAGRVSYTQGFEDPSGLPAEAMLGGWARVSGPFVLRGGLGTGLTRGLGSPVVRGLLMLSYEPPRETDPDFDGIFSSVDACPDIAEDADGFEDTDGCPEPDNDGDGILDVADACPDEAEDVDTWRDEDGCVDPETQVQIRLTDTEGRTILGVAATLTGGESPIEGNADLTAELLPGVYALNATAEGYDTLESEIVVEPGAPMTLTRQLESAVTVGVVTVKIVDQNLQPIPGASVVVGEERLSFPEGFGDIVLMEGSYQVEANAVGFVAGKFPFEVVAGDATTLFIPLNAALGTLVVNVVTPDGTPPEAAYFAATEGAMSVVTQGRGEASLSEGSYDVTFMAPGYQPSLVPITVIAGETASVDVVLKPALVSITRTNVEISEKVFFNTGKSTIRPESYPLLDEVVQALQDYPDLTLVRVEGHTDARGGERSNLELSRRRAASVRDYLVSKGIDAGRLESEGYGESRPIAEGDTETDWALNRRVDFVIVERDGEPVTDEAESPETPDAPEEPEASQTPEP